MTDQTFKILERINLQMQIADIQNRGRNISMWVVDFHTKNGRMPTKLECDSEVLKLEEELASK